MPNWELRKCCNHEQVVFLATLGVCTVVILALWRTVLLLPFKLVTVFIHEASHAIACKLTCGHVEGIQIHADEGGSTETRGGVYWFILPAGYLGSSFWGMVLVLASTNLLTARVAAGCLAVTLLVVLCVAKNWTLRGLCIGLILFLAVIWILQETTKIRILRYIILFIGKISVHFLCDALFVGQVPMLHFLLSVQRRIWLLISVSISCRCNEQLVFCLWYALPDIIKFHARWIGLLCYEHILVCIYVQIFTVI
nr:uncharacterized protein LOC109172144 [Ipomoea batatas]